MLVQVKEIPPGIDVIIVVTVPAGTAQDPAEIAKQNKGEL